MGALAAEGPGSVRQAPDVGRRVGPGMLTQIAATGRWPVKA